MQKVELMLAHGAEGPSRLADRERRVRDGNPFSYRLVFTHRQTVDAQAKEAASAGAEHKTPD